MRVGDNIAVHCACTCTLRRAWVSLSGKRMIPLQTTVVRNLLWVTVGESLSMGLVIASITIIQSCLLRQRFGIQKAESRKHTRVVRPVQMRQQCQLAIPNNAKVPNRTDRGAATMVEFIHHHHHPNLLFLMRGRTPISTSILATKAAHHLMCRTSALKLVWVAAQMVASAITNMRYPLIRWNL